MLMCLNLDYSYFNLNVEILIQKGKNIDYIHNTRDYGFSFLQQEHDQTTNVATKQQQPPKTVHILHLIGAQKNEKFVHNNIFPF